MARTVVLPVDGSAVSEHAVAFARFLAKLLAAQVILVRATPMGPLPGQTSTPGPDLVDAQDELRHVAERLRAPDIDVDCRVINDEPGRAILRLVMDSAADFIIMATHGRGRVGRSIYGSIADRVVRDAPAPVILVPQRATFNWPADPHGFRVLVAMDGSELAERALAPAVALVRATGGELVLGWAVEPPRRFVEEELVGGPLERWTLADLRPAALTAAAEQLEAQGIDVSVMEAIGEPADVLVEMAMLRGAHLIAVATHGRQGLPRLVFGSVAEGILHQAHVPLLCCGPNVRASGAREEVRVG